MAFDVVGATYDIVGQHTILRTPAMCDLRCRRSHLRYRVPHRTYDIALPHCTYDITQYRRYDVVYDVVGNTYEIVATDLRYRR